MNDNKINELLTRGVDKVYPTTEELKSILNSGKKLRVYQGFDPTGKDLHIGHLVGLRKLKQWHDLGHHVIFLIGDFTGMVGDPSGKTTSRIMLTEEEVLKNAKTYKEQAGRILPFEGQNAVEVRFNSEWLAKMSAIDFMRIAKNLSLQQVMERDLFQERFKEGQDVFVNEFLYPVMQAYDSVELDVDLEVGGSDQTFNMLMGRKLMRNMKKKDKFVITTPLLTDSQGRKIGKTEGNVIALTDEPSELYAKIMSLSDDVTQKALEYLTNVPLDEIKELTNDPMKAKKRLAFEVVKQLNNSEDAKTAEESFERKFEQRKKPNESEMQVFPHASNASLATIVQESSSIWNGLEISMSESKRLISQGTVSINDQRITDPIAKNSEPSIMEIGKKRFSLKLEPKEE